MKKILVIEDNLSIREEILAMLEFEGFDAVGAENGEIGVELTLKYLPDLILCDIMMPELDGYQVLEKLRQHTATAAIPFIFLTAKAEKADMRQGMVLGADDYLTKPFTASELLAAINARLEKQAAFVRQAEKKMDDLRKNISLALPHELRTPLTGILGISEMILDEGKTMATNEVIEVTQDIYASAVRLHKLIENYLRYTQVELVATDPEKVRELRQAHLINPGDIIKNLAGRKALAENREDDLILDIAARPTAEVRISEEDFEKIAEELVDNAFKFSQAGTPVHIKTIVDNEIFTIAVQDYGRGMTPEQIAEIGAFTQFEREYYEQQGTGLGLTIAKRLTELYGGQLTIASVPNQQTTVTVSFPVVAVDNPRKFLPKSEVPAH